MSPPKTADPVVRLAGDADVPLLSAALARAFHNDPLFVWIFRREDPRLARSRRYFAARLRLLIPQAAVYTTDDVAAGALWARPNEWRDPPLFALRQLIALAPALGLRMPTTLRSLRAVELRHPRTPHWYLAVLGTDPERQGRGIASALLAPALAACDRGRLPAFLETARERNVDFYNHHGFEVTEQLALPDGPTVWLMWREPRATAGARFL